MLPINNVVGIFILSYGFAPKLDILSASCGCLLFNTLRQGLIQDLEIGCPKSAVVKKILASYFSGETTIEIRHNILVRCQKFHYMIEIDILRNHSHKNLAVLKGDFCRFMCPNDTHIHCWP